MEGGPSFGPAPLLPSSFGTAAGNANQRPGTLTDAWVLRHDAFTCRWASQGGGWRVQGAPDGPDLTMYRLRPWSVLLLSAWCGLVSGLLEVGVIVLRKRTFDPNHLYWMSRHFVWLIPLTNLCIFLVLGVAGVGPGLGLAVAGGAGWPRGCSVAMTLLPPLWSAFAADLRTGRGSLVALGIAARLVPALERHAGRLPAARPGQLSRSSPAWC